LLTRYGTDVRLTLEIGCGHGHFLTAYAVAFPQATCLGMDLVSKRIRLGEKKVEKRGLKNLTFLKAEATEFLEACPANIRLERIFVLYPDPWPKKRHVKNRILQQALLDRLAKMAVAGCQLHFRTDHPSLADWVREQLETNPSWSLNGEAPWPFETGSYFQDMLGTYRSLTADFQGTA
jgi:tRNA (guanine-N7-)-methyltransferase